MISHPIAALPLADCKSVRSKLFLFFVRVRLFHHWSWKKLPELFPTSFPGVQTKRDDVVVHVDLNTHLTQPGLDTMVAAL